MSNENTTVAVSASSATTATTTEPAKKRGRKKGGLPNTKVPPTSRFEKTVPMPNNQGFVLHVYEQKTPKRLILGSQAKRPNGTTGAHREHNFPMISIEMLIRALRDGDFTIEEVDNQFQVVRKNNGYGFTVGVREARATAEGSEKPVIAGMPGVDSMTVPSPEAGEWLASRLEEIMHDRVIPSEPELVDNQSPTDSVTDEEEVDVDEAELAALEQAEAEAQAA